MLTLLFIIFLALTIVLIIWEIKENRWSETLGILSILSGIITFCILIAVTFQCYQVFSRANTISAEIQLYEEENSEIEEKINTVVKEYLEHEKETYKEIKPENVMAALSMFPELNSSDLVKKSYEATSFKNRSENGFFFLHI